MSKFKKMFSEPVSFSEGGWVISREDFTKEEAIEIFKECTGDEFDSIYEDRVKFCMNGSDQDAEDFHGKQQPMWYQGITGRNSKKVWVINDYKNK